MEASKLNQRAAYQATTSTIIKRIGYRLPATEMTADQCDKVTSRIFKCSLPKMGISSKFPLVYQHAPRSRNGLGLPDIRLTQFSGQIKEIVLHTNRKTLNSTLFHTNLELVHLHIGMGAPLWSYSYRELHKLVPDCDAKFLWKECSYFGVKLHKDYARPEVCRLDDQLIMEAVYFSGSYDISDMRKINRCRMHLRALTLSDIATSDGLRITFDSYHGNGNITRRSKIRWPQQPRPPASNWTLWKNAIDTLFVDDRRLRTPLGPWVRTPNQIWDWHVDMYEQKLYHISSTGMITMHSLLQHQRNTRQRYFHVEGQLVLHLPELTVPVSHQIHRGFIRCIEGDAIPRQISITPSTIQEEINNLHHVYRSYLARSSFATVDALPLV